MLRKVFIFTAKIIFMLMKFFILMLKKNSSLSSSLSLGIILQFRIENSLSLAVRIED